MGFRGKVIPKVGVQIPVGRGGPPDLWLQELFRASKVSTSKLNFETDQRPVQLFKDWQHVIHLAGLC